MESTDDRGVLDAAFEQITQALLRIGDEDDPGPKFVSDPVPLPDGLTFWVDSPDASPGIVDQVIATVIEALTDAGIDGRISAPEELPQSPAGPWVCVVVLPLPPTAAGRPAEIPTWQIDRAVSWAVSKQPDAVWVGSGGSALSLPAAAGAELLRDWLAAGRDVQLVADGQGDRRQVTVINPATRDTDALPSLALSRCGSSTVQNLDATYEGLLDEGRELAQGSACVFARVERYDAALGPRPQPTWDGKPRGRDVLASLDEYLLDASPWQLLTPAQAVKLPAAMGDEAEFDPTTRELRLGDIDDWLRDDRWGHHRGTAFERSMRRTLGEALLTQDRAWESFQSLAGEALPQGAADLSALPIVGRPSPHPSLGVTPLQLLCLLRDEPYSDDPFSVPDALRSWLRELGQRLPSNQRPSLRPVVRMIAASTISDGLLVRRTLVDWLIRTLAPDLLDAAEFEGGDALRELDPLTEPFLPLAPCRAALEALLPLFSQILRRRPTWGDEPPEELEAIEAVTTATERAATEFGWSSNWQANRKVSSALHTLRMPGTDVSDDVAQRVWGGGAVAVGTGAFIDAYGHARSSRPRDTSAWWDASRRVDGSSWDASREAAAIALMQEPDASQAWDTAFNAAQAAAPEDWDAALTALRDRFGEEAMDEAWRSARDRMQTLHPQAHLSAALAATAVPAAQLCGLAAVLAYVEGKKAVLVETLWRDIDALVARIEVD